MIELRWVGDILQYRYRYPFPDDSRGTYPMEWTWSDWKDVPKDEPASREDTSSL